MVASAIKKALKPLTKKIMDKLRKNPEDLTQAERKAVRDHARAKATTTTKDGVKIIKHPYMGKAGEVVAKRPKKSDPQKVSPAAIEKFMKKEDAKDRALSAKRLREIRKEDRRESLTGELGFKKGGMVKKCRMDGIALRGKTRAKERSK